MAVGVQQAWSTTAGSNGNADSNVGMAEGQSPPSLNNGVRAAMAAIKGFSNQLLGAKTTGGSSNAYTYTSDSVAAITSYAAGRGFVFKANHTNSGAATFNADGVGATAIRKGGAQTALAANDIVANGIYFVVYNGTYWILLNPESGAVAAQPLDADLTAIAALGYTSGAYLIKKTAADTWSLIAITTAGENLLDDASASAQRTTLGLAIGTNVQAYNAGLAYLAGLAFTNEATFKAGVNLEAADILTALLGVDGAGSGLDADTVDGVQAAALAQLGSANTFTSAQTISNTLPTIIYEETDAGTDEKRWALQAASGLWLLRTQNDAGSTVTNAMMFARSGGTVTECEINATLIDINGNADVSGDFTAGTLAGPPDVSSETGGTLTSASRNKLVQLASNPTLPSSGMQDGDWILLDPRGTARTVTRPGSHTMYVRDSNVASDATYAHNVALAIYHGSSKWTLHGMP